MHDDFYYCALQLLVKFEDEHHNKVLTTLLGSEIEAYVSCVSCSGGKFSSNLCCVSKFVLVHPLVL